LPLAHTASLRQPASAFHPSRSCRRYLWRSSPNGPSPPSPHP
jgi:hypothetical protein